MGRFSFSLLWYIFMQKKICTQAFSEGPISTLKYTIKTAYLIALIIQTDAGGKDGLLERGADKCRGNCHRGASHLRHQRITGGTMKPGDKEMLTEYNSLRKELLVAITGLRKMLRTGHVSGRTFVVSPEFETKVIKPIERAYKILFGEKTPEDKAVIETVDKSFEEHERFASSQPLGAPTGSVWRFIRSGLAAAAVGGAVYVAWQANKRKKETEEK
jgi:hypothetical protein